MNYRDALAWLYGTQTFGIKLGLDNTRAAGIRAGLYTSPHLVDFRERIRVNGVMIPQDAAAEGLTLLREAMEGWDHAPTFFEIATVLAAWWFARENAEYVVWETGMGGRLDATNAVTPLVSVITPIGMDHQQWLGPTLAAIAGEKAGIIKAGVPVVSAPQADEARAVLCARAAEQGSSLCFIDRPYGKTVALPGAHQKWNAAVALAALDAAGLAPDLGVRERGLATVQWPGRFQQVREDLVIDGAHNAGATEVLVSTWRETFGPVKARLVFGALSDKNPGEMLHALRAIADEVVLVPVNNTRSVSVEELRAAAEGCAFPVVRSARLQEALDASSPSPTLVTGSLFLAGEALALLAGVDRPQTSNQ